MTARLPDKQIIILVLLGGVSDMSAAFIVLIGALAVARLGALCNGLMTT